MYNEGQKLLFIQMMEDQGNGVTYLRTTKRLFRIIEEYELEYDKDLCKFTTDEFLKCLKDWDASYGTAANYYSVFKRYAAMFNPENFALYELSLDMIREQFPKASKKQAPIVIHYKDIEATIKDFENPVDKFLLLGLFSGIKGVNYYELSYSSMEGSDPETGLIWLAGEDDGQMRLQSRRFYATNELFTYAKAASEAVNYIQITSNNVKKVNLLKPEGQLIFKKILNNNFEKDAGNKSITVRTKMRLKSLIERSNFPAKTTPADIYKNGLLYTLQKTGLDQGVVVNSVASIRQVADRDIKHICVQYDIDKDNMIKTVEGYF